MTKPKRIKVRKDPKEAYLRRKYGIGLDEYNVILERQGFKCAICLEDKPLGVDHSHATGLVRQLLCRNCNVALGHLQENPEIMSRAIDYLMMHWSVYYDKVEAADAALDGILN